MAKTRKDLRGRSLRKGRKTVKGSVGRFGHICGREGYSE